MVLEVLEVVLEVLEEVLEVVLVVLEVLEVVWQAWLGLPGLPDKLTSRDGLENLKKSSTTQFQIIFGLSIFRIDPKGGSPQQGPVLGVWRLLLMDNKVMF